jgi:hypothetical protein
MEPTEQPQEPVGIAPYLTAILLCDQVIEDAHTKKVTLVGVFERAQASSFPGSVSVTLFVRFTDAEGVYRFRVEYVHVPTNRVLGTVEVTAAPILDRLQPQQIILPMSLRVDEPGPYEVRILANGAYLGRAPLEVVAAQAGGGASHGDGNGD